MDQKSTPYLDAVARYIKENPVRFHYPGHKGILFPLDLTELPQTDNLFSPTGPLLDAQRLTALAFGSDTSYFLVNGSTQGIQSAFISIFRPGDKVLVSYYSHRSVIEGFILSGAEPVFIEERIDRWGIPQNIRLEDVEGKIGEDIKGIVLTNPNYFGLVPEMKEIVDYAHSKGIVVIVDEAHGVHLHFNKKMPISGLDADADVVVQSMHKMGISLTQGALIHIKGDRIDRETLEESVKLLSTTSPSTSILVSMDLARRDLFLNGKRRLDRLIPIIDELRREIEKIGFPVYKRPGMDRTKLTLYSIDGNRVSLDLWEKFKIQPEMSSETYCLFIISLLDSRSTVNTLLNALKDIPVYPPGKADIPPRYTLVQSPRSAFLSPKEKIPVEDSAGRVSGEIITKYPPGLPLLIPGALITLEIKEYLKSLGKTYVSVTLD